MTKAKEKTPEQLLEENNALKKLVKDLKSEIKELENPSTVTPGSKTVNHS